MYASSYNIGNTVDIFADKGINPPTTKIFSGILESIKPQGKGNQETLILAGKDYTTRLIDRTVEPEVYNNLPAGSIVKDIIKKYTDDITVTNVSDTATTIKRIVFNQIPVFDAIRQLAEQSDSVFYIDNTHDLHFGLKSETSSGKTFDDTNIISSTIKEQRNSVFNEIWVYGDRYLDNYQESFTGTGSTFEYTLDYRPHNTDITIDDISQRGAIANMITENTASGANYSVNYEDRLITFQSGTEIGYSSIPGSNASVVMNYMRELPIVKTDKNNESISTYGKRVKVIVDKNIRDPNLAEEILRVALNENAVAKKQGQLQIKGIVDITPSNTCIVNIPFHNINSQTYDILEANYNFNSTTNFSENVLKLKVNKKLPDVTDTLKNILLDIKKLQGADMSNEDLFTRVETSTGSIGIRQSGINVWDIDMGSSFILGGNINGLLGSYSTHTLGDWTAGSVLSWSGGYF
jgi:prophage tail gpP-like protein